MASVSKKPQSLDAEALIPNVACNRIQQVLLYIHQNLHTPLTLEDIANFSGWSRWQLQRMFKRETGDSVASYVRNLRLNEAAQRLIHTTDRVRDIAIMLGFGSEVSLSRGFKKKFGVSPSTFRKHNQLQCQNIK
ncbi:AraC family transcriptional regulator [Vibrio sp. S4M6]|uniref:helix-turn-helix domain-containing protein n=1 Tax=Vibrio sinus TaxID=2946865 RepID=UPI002029E6DD|nr:AraC family transcriptional regulator [Vibrio sinus]MCL9780391.1 AraC family transcriptional regulator [Vibrio sinus]